MTMVIAQIGLPADYLSTVTALVGTAPTLGGVLGVAIVGNGIDHSPSRLPQPLILFSGSDQQRFS